MLVISWNYDTDKHKEADVLLDQDTGLLYVWDGAEAKYVRDDEPCIDMKLDEGFSEITVTSKSPSNPTRGR